MSSAASTSITLTWTAPGDDGGAGSAAQYDIRYSTSMITDLNWDAATQVTGEPLPQAAGLTESFEITGLTPSTTYYIAIKAADEVPNWSALSNVVSSSTTASTTPPGTVADLACSDPTESSLTLSWTAPGADSTVGTAAQYDIRYSTSTISDLNWDAATQVTGEPSPQVAGSSESHVVSGLSLSTTYYFAMKTADAETNWSALSNIATGTTTGDTTPPDAIDDLQAYTGSEHGDVWLEWNAVGDDGLTGTAAYYEIRYSTSTINDANWSSATLWTTPVFPQAAGSAEGTTITGLTPAQVYYFAIKVYDESSNGSAMSNVSSAEAYLDLSLDIDDDNDNLPDDFGLAQNYPNPFNPTTRIEYSLPEQASVTVEVYNVRGQLTRSLVSTVQSPGVYSVEWDGTDSGSNPVASGIYFYRIQANEFSESKKMVMIK